MIRIRMIFKGCLNETIKGGRRGKEANVLLSFACLGEVTRLRPVVYLLRLALLIWIWQSSSADLLMWLYFIFS